MQWGKRGKEIWGLLTESRGPVTAKLQGGEGKRREPQSGERGGDSPDRMIGGEVCTDQRSRGQGGRGPSLGRSPKGQGLGAWLKEWMGVEVRGTEGSLTQFAGRC